MEALLLVDPVDAGAQAHQETGQLGEAGRVALDQEGEGLECAVGGDLHVEVLGQHLPAGQELVRDQIRHAVPGDALVFGVAEGFFVRDADGDEGADVEGCFECDGAEVAEVGEAELVEVFVRDHAVVDEVELDAALDGDYATVGIHEADVGVGCEDGCQAGVHVVAD